MSKVFVYIKVEDGLMHVSGNVDIPNRVFLMQSAIQLIVNESMKPVKVEGRPPDPEIPGTPNSARMPSFVGRTVA